MNKFFGIFLFKLYHTFYYTSKPYSISFQVIYEISYAVLFVKKMSLTERKPGLESDLML